MAYLEAPTGTGIELIQYPTPEGRGPLSPFGPGPARELDPDSAGAPLNGWTRNAVSERTDFMS